MVRILIADDHAAVRRGIRCFLEAHSDWSVCAEAANGREAVTLATQLLPDVAVLDLSMPELDGLEATRRICRACPGTEVLLYTMHASEPITDEIRRAGAHGYVLKSDPVTELVSAVEALASRGTFWGSGVAAFRRRAAGRRLRGEPVRLTPREREIVQLLAEGKTNRSIARLLGISIKTVETHRGHVMLKLGMQSIVELVHYAVRNRLVAA
jgi:DNA-binding NarL/FixJ family response regulator